MPEENQHWNIATLKQHFETLLAERDSHYLQMFQSSQTSVSVALAAAEKAVNAALAAQEKAVNAAFDASEKAIVKAETAQTAYNERSNEFRSALDDQSKQLLPRNEADVRFLQVKDQLDSISKQIVELQKAQSQVEGKSLSSVTAKNNSQWVIALGVSIGMALLLGLAELIFYLATKAK